jgi:hypothetical protein
MWYGSAKEFFYGFILLKLKDIKKSTVKLQLWSKNSCPQSKKILLALNFSIIYQFMGIEFHPFDSQQCLFNQFSVKSDYIGHNPDHQHLKPDDKQDGSQDKRLNMSGTGSEKIIIQKPNAGDHPQQDQQAADIEKYPQRLIHGVHSDHCAAGLH